MNDKQTNGREYWQSLNELAETPAVRAAIETEFPGYDPNQMVGQSRRGFLKLAGASMAHSARKAPAPSMNMPEFQ